MLQHFTGITIIDLIEVNNYISKGRICLDKRRLKKLKDCKKDIRKLGNGDIDMSIRRKILLKNNISKVLLPIIEDKVLPHLINKLFSKK